MRRVCGSAVPRMKSVAAAIVALASAGSASAFQFSTGSDWNVHWDNTVQANLGMRAQSLDPDIANNPANQASDGKFSKAGDLVTERFSLLSEFDAVYQNTVGVRVSASGWKDFAYNSNALTGPGYAGQSNYYNSTYSPYTKRFYEQGAQLLDAFVFSNFDLAGHQTSLKVGRLNQYWGNSLFLSGMGIAYSQSALDLIKAANSPGTTAKELAIPRAQINFSTQITPTWQLGGQYFLEFQGNRLPEGGTFTGPADLGFDGPQQWFPIGGVPYSLQRLDTNKPSNVSNNFGVTTHWSPAWLDGTAGLYYRRFDETQTAGPVLGGYGANGPLSNVIGSFYRFVYPTDTQLIGFSLDKEIGGISTGLEVSYRKNTGLKTNGGVPVASDNSNASLIARGNTLNVLANAVVGLTPTPFYQAGTALFEVGYTHLLSVTNNAGGRFQSVNNSQACTVALANGSVVPGDENNGCVTRNSVVVAFLFSPQWLQVFPGVDLSMPIFAEYGLIGSTASLGVPVAHRDLTYSIGVSATIQQRYFVTLAYNGNHGNLGTLSTNPANGLSYYSGGNNVGMFNDRNWVSLTFSTTF